MSVREIHPVGSPSSYQGKPTLMRDCIMSKSCPSFSKGLSKLSPCWNFVGLEDRPNPNSTNKAHNMSSMRDSS
ncbi:hypothetical protein B296_00013160 [Ensete ventricosum]|uniref:Uncharacterized protein n=1 Tax=Ensete ventricosum TaxID=4639 RepID=A0A427A160_ENSVE|nr:hypothetical protein B296_00013160 [Ensete ventricosum]